MTAPTDQSAALALLRERFPESAGWVLSLRQIPDSDWLAWVAEASGAVFYGKRRGPTPTAAVDALLKAHDEAFPAVADRDALLAVARAVHQLHLEETGHHHKKACGHPFNCICVSDGLTTALAALPAHLQKEVAE